MLQLIQLLDVPKQIMFMCDVFFLCLLVSRGHYILSILFGGA